MELSRVTSEVVNLSKFLLYYTHEKNRFKRRSRRLAGYRWQCKSPLKRPLRNISQKTNVFTCWRRRLIPFTSSRLIYLLTLTQIQSLRDERANKAREFSEAQQHIGRLMNVMGFTANPQIPPVSTQEQLIGTERQHLNKMHEPTYDDDESQLAESFDELASNVLGPSPKRPKANRLSMNPGNLQPPKTPTNGSSKQSCPKSTIQPARQPLGPRDCNSPRKLQSSQGLKQGQYSENHLQSIDLDMDLDFSNDFLFSSTASSGSNDQVGTQ